MHWWLKYLVLLAVCCASGAAGAQSKKSTPIGLSGRLTLGNAAPTTAGWFACNIRITNSSQEPIEGTIELVSQQQWYRDSNLIETQAPFSVPPNGSVALQLPTHSFDSSPPELHAIARSNDGDVLRRVELNPPSTTNPLLFSLAVPLPIASELRHQSLLLASRYSRHVGAINTPTLEVGIAEVQSASGELLLPERPAGYTSATVVFAPTDVLERIGDQRRQAVADWVLGGGSLAVVMSRPEDLRAPFVTTLVGATVERTPPHPGLRTPQAFEVQEEGLGWKRLSMAPTPDVASMLSGYAGGNLRPTQWGAAATYGLGEVHLLAFDPREETTASDPWVRLQLVELVRHSWNRRIHIALPHGETPLDRGEIEGIRRLLDPNQGTRWSIVAATLILLLYSVLAGPLSFYLAAKRNRPLRALWQLPIWSLGTLLVIVGLGMLARGLSGEARRLTLIEAGAGMNRASVTRFRAFYSSGSRELTVRASEYGNVLEAAGFTDGERVLKVDRDGFQLQQLRAVPWETVLVREDGFTRFGEGISLTPVGHRDVQVKNRSGYDLAGVVVARTDGSAAYLEHIADGASVSSAEGDPLPGAFPLREVAKRMNHVEENLSEAWDALRRYATSDTQWWPTGAPVLVAQLVGGEGQLTDSGLRLREDRVLVRVVGFGGRP